jgi:hypothetical protein
VYENFCASCGQKADTPKLNWHYLFHDIPHSILHIDKGFFYTAKELFIRPSATVRNYLDGKRIKHFKPVAYAFLLGIIMSIVIDVEIDKPFQTNPSSAIETTQEKEAEGIHVRGDIITYVFSHHYGLLVILCVPIYAFFGWSVYRKERNYVEILTAFLFIFGHTTWFALFLAFGLIFDNVYLEGVLGVLWLTSILLYSLWGITEVFTLYKRPKRILATLFIFSAGFFASAIAIAFGLYQYSKLISL